MMPATRGLLEMMRGLDDPAATYVPDERASHDFEYDPQIVQLKMKKRHQMAILRKILEDGGYGELAKMSRFSKDDIE